MKFLKYLILVVFLVPSLAFAVEFDTTRKGSINVLYKYGEELVSDTNVYLYQVAKYDSNKELKYVDGFTLTNSLGISSTSEAIALAEILSNYIDENDIKFIKKCVTDEEGSCGFEELELGAYLLKSSSKTNLEKQYYANPSLVGLPFDDEITHEIKYDANLILKTEVKDVSCPECNIKKFTIKTKVVNGTIDPGVEIEEGKDVTINYKANDGYVLKVIKIDGNSIDISVHKNNYIFKNVTADHEIEVIYEKEIVPVPDVEITKTLDDIFTYVFLFGGSILFIIMIVYSIHRLRKIRNQKLMSSNGEESKKISSKEK